jgi:hypothetical protein
MSCFGLGMHVACTVSKETPGSIFKVNHEGNKFAQNFHTHFETTWCHDPSNHDLELVIADCVKYVWQRRRWLCRQCHLKVKLQNVACINILTKKNTQNCSMSTVRSIRMSYTSLHIFTVRSCGLSHSAPKNVKCRLEIHHKFFSCPSQFTIHFLFHIPKWQSSSSSSLLRCLSYDNPIAPPKAWSPQSSI